MKSCKRWISTGGTTTCALCRVGYPAGSKGVLADLAAPIDDTTIVKFVCLECAAEIGRAIATAPAPSRGQR